MNLHWCALNHGGFINLGIGTNKKTHENIKKTGAFTVSLATKDLIKAADYFGSVSSYRDPNKFTKTGLKESKSKYVHAPIIEVSKLVMECELVEIVNQKNIDVGIGRILNVSVDESVLNELEKLDTKKIDMIFFDYFKQGILYFGRMRR